MPGLVMGAVIRAVPGAGLRVAAANAHKMMDPSTLEVRTQKSFDFAIDVTRQLMTLSAAILALTVTVARDIETGDPEALAAAWGAFLTSMVFGVLALFALMAELRPTEGEEPPSVAAWRVRTPAILQIAAFVIGSAFLFVFGVSALE
jgi:hypothetical protein